MLEHLKYHCKHNEAKPNGTVAITVAAFDTESAAMEFVKNNPQYDVDEIWFMENQGDTWVPVKTVWTKEKKNCKNCGYRDNCCDTFKCNVTGNCVDHEQWIPTKEVEKTWIIVDDCEYFVAKCPVCGRIVDSRSLPPVCPRCRAMMSNPQNRWR